jgi:hypothetical protein
MTEAEWLGCHDPTKMLGLLRGKMSDRKFRLFAVGCCRRISHLLTDARSRNAVNVLERYADLLVSAAEAEEARDAAEAARQDHLDDSHHTHSGPGNAELAVVYAITTRNLGYEAVTAAGCAAEAARAAIGDATGYCTNEFKWTAAWSIECLEQCRLLRDICIYPGGYRGIGPAWLGWNNGIVPALADGIYADGAFDRLAVLADALEDAGCTDQAILDHLRSPGPHVRGCWAVDFVTARE